MYVPNRTHIRPNIHEYRPNIHEYRPNIHEYRPNIHEYRQRRWGGVDPLYPLLFNALQAKKAPGKLF